MADLNKLATPSCDPKTHHHAAWPTDGSQYDNPVKHDNYVPINDIMKHFAIMFLLMSNYPNDPNEKFSVGHPWLKSKVSNQFSMVRYILNEITWNIFPNEMSHRKLNWYRYKKHALPDTIILILNTDSTRL